MGIFESAAKVANVYIEQVRGLNCSFAGSEGLLEGFSNEVTDARHTDRHVVEREDHLADPKSEPAFKHAPDQDVTV